MLLADKNGPVRLDEHGELHLSPLAAEVVDSAVLAERDAVIARLPALPLTELLIETDLEAGWSKHLTHAGGAKPRVPEIEHRRTLRRDPRAGLQLRHPAHGRDHRHLR